MYNLLYSTLITEEGILWQEQEQEAHYQNFCLSKRRQNAAEWESIPHEKLPLKAEHGLSYLQGSRGSTTRDIQPLSENDTELISVLFYVQLNKSTEFDTIDNHEELRQQEREERNSEH